MRYGILTALALGVVVFVVLVFVSTLWVAIVFGCIATLAALPSYAALTHDTYEDDAPYDDHDDTHDDYSAYMRRKSMLR